MYVCVTTPPKPLNRFQGSHYLFDIEIEGLSRTLKFHFQGPILDGSLQHEQ